jgi:lipopolysaccharide transport system permease protein
MCYHRDYDEVSPSAARCQWRRISSVRNAVRIGFVLLASPDSSFIGERLLSKMKSLFLNLYRGRHILKTMVIKDIKARYAGSLFGPLWIIVTPLYQILLYTFLFSTILRIRFDEGAGTSSFVVYLLAGMIPWLFFSEATTRGVSAFIDNAHIIKKVKFPVEVCVATVIISSAVTFLVYMIFYFAMLIVMGVLKFQTVALFLLPVGIQVLLILGLSFGLGSLAVFFRDIATITGMALNLVFFLTPIVYPATAIPERLRGFFNINPFYFIVEMSRSVLVRGEVPNATAILYPSIVALAIFFAGYYIFCKTKEAFKDIL